MDIMVEAFSGSEKKAEDSLTYYKEIPEPQEKLSNKDRARQRWKILCLVKVSERNKTKNSCISALMGTRNRNSGSLFSIRSCNIVFFRYT